jgi:hypothetical protein
MPFFLKKNQNFSIIKRRFSEIELFNIAVFFDIESGQWLHELYVDSDGVSGNNGVVCTHRGQRDGKGRVLF